MKTVISTPNAPGAIGPYSPGLRLRRPGHHLRPDSVDPATGAIPEGIAAQAEQSCRTWAPFWRPPASLLESVVKTTCFLADMGDFAAFNEVYAKYFTSKPARSCVAVRAAQGRALRDRGHRRQVNLISSKESRSPEGPALLFARGAGSGPPGLPPAARTVSRLPQEDHAKVPGPQ